MENKIDCAVCLKNAVHFSFVYIYKEFLELPSYVLLRPQNEQT
jgi:hypothetical protein